jgi:hypothetical protein
MESVAIVLYWQVQVSQFLYLAALANENIAEVTPKNVIW